MQRGIDFFNEGVDKMMFSTKHKSFKIVHLTTEQRTFIVRTFFQTNSPPATIEELRERIVREFDILRRRPEMVRRAVRHMESRVILCIERGGRHVEGHVVP